MRNNHMATPDIVAYDAAVTKLRAFFKKKGFVEVHTQDRLSILAACEDPSTVATFEYAGEVWPLPQTGQMWLEYELLSKPELPGVFCVSTSYRLEPHPVPGRHNLIFPMFEFEAKGTMDDLRGLEAELLQDLGFGSPDTFPHKTYAELAEKYGTDDLSSDNEAQMDAEIGHIVFLEHFPESTSPFWNMRRPNDGSDTANKIDVIMHGMETIGSAERSIDVADMRNRFMSISDGKYAEKLFTLFGKDRVMAELDDFLSFDFFPRFGGGMGMTRMIRALQKSNLI